MDAPLPADIQAALDYADQTDDYLQHIWLNAVDADGWMTSLEITSFSEREVIWRGIEAITSARASALRADTYHPWPEAIEGHPYLTHDRDSRHCPIINAAGFRAVISDRWLLAMVQEYEPHRISLSHLDLYWKFIQRILTTKHQVVLLGGTQAR